MRGAPSKPPSLATLRALLAAAVQTGGPRAATLEMCLLTLCLPWEAVDIDLERIDWRNGTTEVAARGGRTRTLILTPAAQKTVLRVAESAGGTGQVVTAGRGRRLDARDVRIDRLKDELADSTPGAGIAEDWHFHGVRAAGAGELVVWGVELDDVRIARGLHERSIAGFHETPSRRIDRARRVLEIWNRLLVTGD